MYQEMSDDALVQEVYQWGAGDGVANSHREAAKAELTRRLQHSIAKLTNSTERYSKWLIALTMILAFLTLALVGLTLFLVLRPA